ncbi:hypothetical protein [Aquimarina sp. 2201CG14-23]|uniref:hypothetical protein n=1 Tax=Aquimarina mycalae TaxID=3040073 RepID=UPI002477E33C|nr:hypothetical protein [Aquimarina sp. 2201CG14-23]MDH7445523.1 hypothetical protein [Aquimarina sp. 2201CG14-23]
MLAEYFNLLQDTFSKAATETIQHSISVAGKNVNLRFANSRLASKLLPALAHLDEAIGNQTDLTVSIWDYKSSGIPLPKSPSFKGDFTKLDKGIGYNMRYSDIHKPRFIYVPTGLGFMCLFDPISKHAFYWYPDVEALPYYERGAPMHTLFDWWLASQGMLLTHAAAIGNHDGGVLIVGKGGQGKSTTAISSLWSDGLYYISDDYLILENVSSPKVYSLYNTGKLDYEHVQTKLPHLLPLLDNPLSAKEEKGLFFFNRTHRSKIKSSLQLTSAILPQVTTQKHTTISSIKPMKLLIGLAASTMYQSSGSNAEGLKILTKTISDLPCYALNIGQNLDEISKSIKEIIDQHHVVY